VDNLLSPEEVKQYLEVQDRDIDHFVQRGKLHAYKIGGTFLRFRKEEVLALKQEFRPAAKARSAIPWYVRILDFWRFNNFYILSLILIAVLLFILVRS
jgi:excisionase family DNA binding protein